VFYTSFPSTWRIAPLIHFSSVDEHQADASTGPSTDFSSEWQ